MKRRYRIVGEILILILFSIGLVACGREGIVRPANLYQDMEGKRIKSAYIVVDDKFINRGIELHIKKALTENGILSSIGPLTNKPDTVDIYVTFIDRWKWDMAMFLFSLDISFYKNSSGSLLAAGKYETPAGMHGFPKAEKITRDVVQSILIKMNHKDLASSPQQ